MIDTSLGIYLVTYGELRALVRAGGRDSQEAQEIRAQLAEMEPDLGMDQRYIVRAVLGLLDDEQKRPKNRRGRYR